MRRLRNGEDEGQRSPDRGGFGRREEAGVDTSDDGADQDDDRQKLVRDVRPAHRFDVVCRAHGADETGHDVGHAVDGERHGERQQDTRNHSGDEQPPDRGFRDQAVDDQEQARRDQHPEHRRAGNRSDRKARGVAVLHHRRHRDPAEHCGGCDRTAHDGGEDRVGSHGRNAEPAAQFAQQARRDLERVAPDVGLLQHQAHHDEQRDHAELVGRDAGGGGEPEGVDR
jgi:hypothetical protein